MEWSIKPNGGRKMNIQIWKVAPTMFGLCSVHA